MKTPSVMLAVCAALMIAAPVAAYENNLDMDVVHPLNSRIGRRSIRNWLHDKFFPSEIDITVTEPITTLDEPKTPFEVALSEARAKMETLSAEIDALDTNSGLFGAIKVQSHYRDFYGTLEQVSLLSDTEDTSDLHMNLIANLVEQYNVLLNILNNKYHDFEATGTAKIPAHYISQMANTTFEIYVNLISKVSNDSKKLKALCGPLDSLTNAFQSSFRKYSVPSDAINAIPKCLGCS